MCYKYVVSGLDICPSSCSMLSDSCSDVFACKNLIKLVFNVRHVSHLVGEGGSVPLDLTLVEQPTVTVIKFYCNIRRRR